VTNNPARDNSRLHGARQLSYTRGADSDKAIEFLSGLVAYFLKTSYYDPYGGDSCSL